MPRTKIVVIGAGSAGVGLDTLCDLIAHRETLHGSTIGLVDVDSQGLDKVLRLGQRLNEASDAGFTFQASTDRRQVLPGAEFVLMAVEVNRLPLWRLDWEIPRQHGVRHILGENSGPGGLSHALRTIPVVLDICRDIERLCPNALLIDFTNPVARICLAISRYTHLRVIGLCHQIGAGYANVAQVLGIQEEELDLKAAGINHFTWIMDMRHKPTGDDLYPTFRERLKSWPSSFEPLSRHLFDAFGLYPATGDDHLGEDVGYAWETNEMAAHPEVNDRPAVFIGQEGIKATTTTVVDEALEDDEALEELLEHRSGERIVPTICATLENRNQYEVSVDVVNGGAIPNLPDWAIVEGPAVVSGAGVHPLCVGPLPEGIAALLSQRISIHSLTVEAAVHGNRQAALQALLLDPVVNSYDTAVAVLDGLLSAHAAYLPAFGNVEREM